MKRMTSALMTGLCAIFLPGLLMMGVSLAAPSAAQACRDCPFPMKIGEHRWLLPSGDIVLTIEEQQISDNVVLMTITLEDSSNGRFIASGRVSRSRYQHEVSVPMRDRRGHKMSGRLEWSDTHQNGLQAEFNCFDMPGCLNGNFNDDQE